MPQRPPRVCAHPGCSAKTRNESRYCLAHKPNWKPWGAGARGARVVKGKAYDQARELLFAANPLCVHCEKQGRMRLATIRDHIIPLAFGGEDCTENTQGLCEECHAVKTEEEKREGSKRSWEGYRGVRQ